jgi:hypothetical protein
MCKNTNLRTKVYILGAGCSVCGEYPIASQVTARLLDFARTKLDRDEAEKLRRCTLDTCRRMMEMGVETIDQLAGNLNGSESNVISDAKLAMSVYFLSLEEGAVGRALDTYTVFFEELFRYGDSNILDTRVKVTPCRVITYNYDRIFERTFIEWVKRIEPCNEDMARGMDSFVSNYLNTGLGDPHDISFKPNRFSFLKLHGGVRQFSRDDDYDFKHITKHKFGSTIPNFTDENYYFPDRYVNDVPTIILPADKSHNNIQNGRSFEDYRNTLENQALEFCQLSEEIQIIGYSIQAIDYFSFKKMIAAAKDCKRIIVRNRASEESRLLRTLEGLKEEFAAKWEIEFKAEDFFARNPQ